MTSLLSRLFVKNYRQVKDPVVRRSYGTMVSIVGIIANVLLAALKLAAGVISGSVSVMADGWNNLSDAGSQVISLISFKLSAKPADRDHPFGHARFEYVASMIVSFLVLLVGVDLVKESVAKLGAQEQTVFSAFVFVILGISVLVKLWLFFFGLRIGKQIASPVIKATATDSLSDAAATLAVLVSAVISRVTGFELDAYMGILVAVLIFVAGIRILNETKNSILGSAPDPEVVESLRNMTREYPQILGIHDMVVHNYGPGNTIASFHAEVDGSVSAFDTHDTIDNLERRILRELGVRATIHMDPVVTDDQRVQALRFLTRDVVKQVDVRLDIHDFRYVEGKTHSNLIFDVTIPFEIKEKDETIKERISDAISRVEPSYFAVISVDRE